ncbi:LamB/YcsF family protein [Paenibacillus provencensis]|uniref:5-oxoprolinase subunit A n=1 Tax=Paenibacillus provencensis TaxID=441151 RepID=A0ABW3Q0G5_9BACL|nr:5-oxoprolinase subunit PxpA [Paenibacillus sp. MER 78]MCM3127817.1 LamB/YcsF family protein [Paenibacillus sp. MER 78]
MSNHLAHKLQIDLNCDLGEGYGAYPSTSDAQMMKYISSANIACGYHAGDPGKMREAVQLALAHGVAIGAHPSLPDLIGFGRREMAVTPQEVFDMTLYQIGALIAIAKAEGAELSHVKPHGALYNMAAEREPIARAIAEAVYRVDSRLILFGLAGSHSIHTAEEVGIRTASEVFADRTYEAGGTLTPRHIKGAVIHDSSACVRQALRMIQSGEVISREGTPIKIKADTLCIHGDTPEAIEHALQLREAFKQQGIEVRRAGEWV